jgi:hypothetical protein
LSENADKIKHFLRQVPDSVKNKAELADIVAKIKKLNGKVDGANRNIKEGRIPENALDRAKQCIEDNLKEIDKLNFGVEKS